MRKSKKLLSLICAAAMSASALTACGGNSDNSSSAGDNSESSKSKSRDNTFTISLDNIAEDMGAGWNYGNTMEAVSNQMTSETAWGNPVACQEMIDAVAAAGFKTIRVPVSYIGKIDDDNGYKIDEAWLDRVQEVVEYCYNDDLYVIINVHGDGYNSIPGGWLLCNSDDQETIKAKYEAVWKQIAEKFADYDEHLIFESMNEEFDGEYNDPNPEYYSNINDYNQIFVDTVRNSGSNNTHRWLLIPGWNTDITYTAGDYGFELPTDNNTSGEGRILISVHYYTPWDYCGQENNKNYVWGKKGEQIIAETGITSKALGKWGNEDDLEDFLGQMKEVFVDKGYPVIIGEYGCIDKTLANQDISGEIAENRAYFNSYLAGTAASMGMIPVYWDNGYNGQYGFGLFNRNTYEQTQPEIITSIISAVKEKNPAAGFDVSVDISVEKQSSVHAYIGIQTNKYTFRNSYSDGQYGYDSEWFNTLIKWEDTDGDGKDDIIDSGAVFEDAEITGDGTYTVGVSGYDFSSDSDGLNMLFISTDFPFYSTMSVKDVKLYVDDEEFEISKPVVSTDDQGNLYIEIVNIYNTETETLDYTMPSDSFKVSFTIKGTSNVIE